MFVYSDNIHDNNDVHNNKYNYHYYYYYYYHHYCCGYYDGYYHCYYHGYFHCYYGYYHYYYCYYHIGDVLSLGVAGQASNSGIIVMHLHVYVARPHGPAVKDRTAFQAVWFRLHLVSLFHEHRTSTLATAFGSDRPSALIHVSS